MTKCDAGFFGRHKFRPRYEMRCVGVNADQSGDIYASRTGQNIVNRVYVRDLCVLCGETIER